MGLENTHPFSRELWGQYWIFAHNGNILNFHPILDGTFAPVGNTDSELVFCWIMQELRKKFGNTFPGNEAVFATIQELSVLVHPHGEFNFLLSNGRMLIAHCSTRLTYIIRKAPFAEARLKDQDLSVDFSALTGSKDRVAIIATVPLTENETWTDLLPGSLVLFQDGEILRQEATTAPPKK